MICLQGTAASTKNKLPTLITSMESIGAKALEEFADSIKARITSLHLYLLASRANPHIFHIYSPKEFSMHILVTEEYQHPSPDD